MCKITWVQDGDYTTILKVWIQLGERLADYLKKTNSKYIIGDPKGSDNYKYGLYFIDNSKSETKKEIRCLNQNIPLM